MKVLLLSIPQVIKKIDKERKIATRHVKGRLNSLKKQGAQLNDVKGATIVERLQEFSGNFW